MYLVISIYVLVVSILYKDVKNNHFKSDRNIVIDYGAEYCNRLWGIIFLVKLFKWGSIPLFRAENAELSADIEQPLVSERGLPPPHGFLWQSFCRFSYEFIKISAEKGWENRK